MKIDVALKFVAPTPDLEQLVRQAIGYKSEMAAGIDLAACIAEPIEIPPLGAPVLIPTGIAVHVNDPRWMLALYPRSGAGHKRGLVLGNGTGIIDADYQGEIKISAWNRNRDTVVEIQPGERIAQMVLQQIAQMRLSEVPDFEASARGADGFGSTGTVSVDAKTPTDRN